MPDFSLLGGGNRIEEGGSDTSNSTGTTITAAGSAHTKGAYAQLIASTGFVGSHLAILAQSESGSFHGLFDIAVGAAASEQDVISNLHLCAKGTEAQFLIVPLTIAAGSRISARCQASSANEELEMQVMLFGNTLANTASLSRVTTYGANTADSGGVQVDPGAVANTKGSYSEITSSTTDPIRALVVAIGNQNNFNQTNAHALLDIAVGAATSEQVIISNMLYSTSTTSDRFHPIFAGPFPVNIPIGTRIAARSQSSNTDATDRLIDVIVYGFD